MRRALPFLGLAALVAVLVIGLTQAGGKSDSSGSEPDVSPAQARERLKDAPPPLAALYERGNEIEAASVDDLRGELRSLRGHPVVVNVWASWCGPCKLEFPVFQRVSAALGKRVAFLGVNSQDNRGDAEGFLRSKPVPYPSFEDGDGKLLQEVAPGVSGLPTTVYYGADGKRSFIHQGGYAEDADLVRDIRQYTGA